MGITIIDVKIVGFCSKHGGNLLNKNGDVIPDKDIACIECDKVFKKVNIKNNTKVVCI